MQQEKIQRAASVPAKIPRQRVGGTCFRWPCLRDFIAVRTHLVSRFPVPVEHNQLSQSCLPFALLSPKLFSDTASTPCFSSPPSAWTRQPVFRPECIAYVLWPVGQPGCGGELDDGRASWSVISGRTFLPHNPPVHQISASFATFRSWPPGCVFSWVVCPCGASPLGNQMVPRMW